MPNVLRLISGFCSSPRDFALDFLLTPPRDDALVLRLIFGSSIAGVRTCTRLASCHARHTRKIEGRRAFAAFHSNAELAQCWNVRTAPVV